jgi:hypothetical protein
LLTVHFAFSFWEALVCSFAFSSGGLLAFLIVKEVQKRSFLESIVFETAEIQNDNPFVREILATGVELL